MSEIVVDKYSDSSSCDLTENSSNSDNESLVNMKKINLYNVVKSMVKSEASIDKRFINLYRVRKARHSGVKLGLTGLEHRVIQPPATTDALTVAQRVEEHVAPARH